MTGDEGLDVILEDLPEGYIEEIKKIWSEVSCVCKNGEDVNHPAKVSTILSINEGSTRFENLQRRAQDEKFDSKKIVDAIEDQSWL